jgi:hypothetical protein
MSGKKVNYKEHKQSLIYGMKSIINTVQVLVQHTQTELLTISKQ